MCSIDDCGKPVHRKGWCAGHYLRWWRYGDPEGRPPERPAVVSYIAVHSRLRSTFGPASTHLCADCLGPARQWAYLHDDPDQFFSAKGFPFSTKLECYAPMCRPCHGAMDGWASGRLKVRHSRDEEILALRREGETLRAIGARFGITYQRVAQIVAKGTPH